MTSRAKSSVTDLVLAVVLIAASGLLLVAAYLQVAWSASALGALAVVIGVLTVVAALAGRTSAGFFTEIVSGVILVVLGGMILAGVDPGSLSLLAGCLYLVSGGVRLASVTEFPDLRWICAAGGIALIVVGGVLLSGAVAATIGVLGLAVAAGWLIDGVTVAVVGRRRAG